MQRVNIRVGDSSDVLEGMDPESVWAVVCDPPYDLTAKKKGGSGTSSISLSTPHGRSRVGVGNGSGGFMGKQWDSTGVAFSVEFWQKVYKVLKPGGVLKTFGGSRTFHKMAKSIEEAGFAEITLEAWLYSSGFPKSLNVSRQIDKSAGTNGNTDLSRAWGGWGTALKPSWEPIIVARKPI